MSFYEMLDVRKNATPEVIREAYVRAKHAFANESLATYSLFDRDQSRKMLEEIESAYNILSDPDKRRRYDQAHGYIRSAEPLRALPTVMEFGEEVSEIGMSDEVDVELDNAAPAGAAPAAASTPAASASIETLFFANRSDDSAARPSSAPAPASQAGSDTPFAARYAAANPKNGKEAEPLSKNFIPNASMNPNAHYIHKRHSSDSEIEQMLGQAEAVDGEFLRKAREYRGVSLEEMMEFTKLTRKYLESLEGDAVDKLPAPVYVRGFILQYSKALQLDASRVAASYMRNFQSLREARGLR